MCEVVEKSIKEEVKGKHMFSEEKKQILDRLLLLLQVRKTKIKKLR